MGHNKSVNRVVLVGDPMQNIIRAEHGLYAEGHIRSCETGEPVKLNNLPGCMFRACFRCPGGDIMRLNQLGYSMIPHFCTPSGLRLITGKPGDQWDDKLPGGDLCLRIAFTHADAEKYCLNRDNIVASMQGQTLFSSLRRRSRSPVALSIRTMSLYHATSKP